MALIISDLHGNYSKCKAFIDYKPKEEHCILGDFMDSFSATNEEIISTFKMAVDNNVTLLAGNHELPYLSNAHNYFKCSGNREQRELFHCVNAYKDLLHGALVRDGYLLTHGGLSRKHGKPFNTIEEACDWINMEFDWYKNQPVPPEKLSSIFDIGSVRGGREQVSGIFWCSIGYENMDIRFNQIVGHTCRQDPVVLFEGKKDLKKCHVGIDSRKYICYNTVTNELEDFMMNEFKDNFEMRRVLERQF
jgi:calcineurin-like phosphoesterase family protein